MDPNIINGKLIHPFTFLVVGRSKVGKTTLILNIIENREKLIQGQIKKIIYVYGIDTPEYHTFHAKYPFIEFTTDFDERGLSPNTLLILDDMQTAITGPLRKRLTDFVTRNVSHSMCSVILTLHNLYASPLLRTIALQVDYLVYFHNSRDVSIVNRLGYQMYPRCSKFLEDVYNYVTSKSNRAYLFIDISVDQQQKWRIRDSIQIDETTNLFVPVRK